MGQVQFGHTHPEYSNSGLVSLFAIAYAAVGKTTSLEINDLIDPKVGDFIKGIENSVLQQQEKDPSPIAAIQRCDRRTVLRG
jgi:Ca-activated chloride channel homolog